MNILKELWINITHPPERILNESSLDGEEKDLLDRLCYFNRKEELQETLVTLGEKFQGLGKSSMLYKIRFWLETLQKAVQDEHANPTPCRIFEEYVRENNLSEEGRQKLTDLYHIVSCEIFRYNREYYAKFGDDDRAMRVLELLIRVRIFLEIEQQNKLKKAQGSSTSVHLTPDELKEKVKTWLQEFLKPSLYEKVKNGPIAEQYFGPALY